MSPGRAPQKRRWRTEKDPGCPVQERCFYLSVSSDPFSAFATISGQLHVSDWELDTDNMDPHGPVPARCGMIVSRYSPAPPSLKHSLLLVFVFVFIWKLTLKFLTKHLQNAQTYTRMRPKSHTANGLSWWKSLKKSRPALQGPAGWFGPLYWEHPGVRECYFTRSHPTFWCPCRPGLPLTTPQQALLGIYLFLQWFLYASYEAMCWALGTF